MTLVKYGQERAARDETGGKKARVSNHHPHSQTPKVFSLTNLLYDFFFFNLYLFLRERQSVSGGGAETEGDTESEAGSRIRAVSSARRGAQTRARTTRS